LINLEHYQDLNASYNLVRIADAEFTPVDRVRPTVLDEAGTKDRLTSHVHLLININPKVQISAFANNLKTVSSRFIRKKFPVHCAKFYRKAVFCQIGYYVSSTGGANLETVKKYIKQQDSSTCL